MEAPHLEKHHSVSGKAIDSLEGLRDTLEDGSQQSK
jgi:hypothetical protein